MKNLRGLITGIVLLILVAVIPANAIPPSVGVTGEIIILVEVLEMVPDLIRIAGAAGARSAYINERGELDASDWINVPEPGE